MAISSYKKYIRDAAGNVWIMEVIIEDSGFMGKIRFMITCKYKPNSYDKNTGYCHKIDADVMPKEKIGRIVDTWVHPDFRNLGIGKWMVSELARFCKKHDIKTITGKLSPIDALTPSMEMARNGFWRKCNAVISEDGQSFIIKNFSIKSRAVEISKSEYELQLRFNKTFQELTDCKKRLESCTKQLKKLRTEHPVFKLGKSLVELIIYLISLVLTPVAIIVSFFNSLKKTFKKDKSFQNKT